MTINMELRNRLLRSKREFTEMLEQFTYKNSKLHFTTPAMERFRGLVKFDSLNLLIGSNGSGKTTLLLDAAKVLSQGAVYGDLGNYSYLDDHGISQTFDTRQPAEEYGFVYFTSLPYRRPFQRGERLLDASRKLRGEMPRDAIRVLTEVTTILGVKARLKGRIEFYPKMFEDVFGRFLVDRPQLINNNPVISEILQELKLHGDAGLTGETARTDKVALLKKQLSAYLQELIIGALRQHGRYYDICSLAALDRCLTLSRTRDDLISYFLGELGVIEASSHPSVAVVSKFVGMRDMTFSYLSDYDPSFVFDSDNTYNCLQFEIASDAQRRYLPDEHLAITFEWEGLSSGLLALVEQFASLHRAMRTLAQRGLKRQVLLIDEGDAFLHLDWQRLYISLLNRFLGEAKREYKLNSLQVVVATHSPILAGDLPTCMIQRLGMTTDAKDYAKTFGAPLDDIIWNSFKSNTIGELAAEHIRAIAGHAKESQLNEFDLALMEEIGDPLITRAIRGQSGN